MPAVRSDAEGPLKAIMNKTKMNKNVFHLLTHSLILTFHLTNILSADQILNTEEKNNCKSINNYRRKQTVNLNN